MFDKIREFESALAKFTGAPYAVMTDCCTHAIELCLYNMPPKRVEIPAHTYISIPMTLRKLDIPYTFKDINWVGEYRIEGTSIWDSARKLSVGMYRPGQFQCLSFGHDKPLSIGHGGAILLDDEGYYKRLIRQRYDGRDLSISPWQDQRVFEQGFHYRPTIEDALRGLELLPQVDQTPKPKEYPDLREILFL